MTVSHTRAVLVVFVLALVGFPGSATAAMDSVKGDGSINQLGLLKAHLVINAKSDASGSHPTGEVSAAASLAGVPFTFHGPVACMQVSGNQAVVKYDFADASPSIFKGGGIEIFIKDAGPGLQDSVGFLPPQDPLTWTLLGPSRCDPLFLAPFGVVSGDFKINDA